MFFPNTSGLQISVLRELTHIGIAIQDRLVGIIYISATTFRLSYPCIKYLYVVDIVYVVNMSRLLIS